MKKSLSVIVLAATLSTTVVACTGEEIVRGVGAVAIGAAVVLGGGVSTDHPYPADHHHQCRSGYREVCHSYVTYRGNVIRECRQVFDDCYRYDAAAIAATESLSDVAAGIPLINEDFAKEFGMSFEAANAFVASMRRAAEGDGKALASYGFSDDDMEQLAMFKLPSKQAIESLAGKLDMMYESTEGMLNRMRAWGLSEKTRREAEGKRL